MIELRQLKALLAIQDFKSFSQAANNLNTVQSNISAHLSRLEESVGAILVDRRTGVLTEEGAAVALRARRLLSELEAIDSDISALKNDVRGRVRVGMIGTVARWFVPAIVRELEERHPNVKVEISEGTASALESRVNSNAFEFAIMTRPSNTDELVFRAFFEEPLVLVAAKEFGFEDKASIALSEVASQPLLLPPKGTQFRDQVDLVAAQIGVVLTPKAEIDGVRLLASMAFDGFAPTIAPATSIPAFMTGRLSVIPIEGLLPRRVGLARRKKVAHSAAAKTVLALLEEFFTNPVLAKKHSIPSVLKQLL